MKKQAGVSETACLLFSWHLPRDQDVNSVWRSSDSAHIPSPEIPTSQQPPCAPSLHPARGITGSATHEPIIGHSQYEKGRLSKIKWTISWPHNTRCFPVYEADQANPRIKCICFLLLYYWRHRGIMGKCPDVPTRYSAA